MENTTANATFLDMTKERWSIRRFADEQISDEHMARILEAGRNAPSACPCSSALCKIHRKPRAHCKALYT